jgi:hypothetical protein
MLIDFLLSKDPTLEQPNENWNSVGGEKMTSKQIT